MHYRLAAREYLGYCEARMARVTDRPDMTLAVDRQSTKSNPKMKNIWSILHRHGNLMYSISFHCLLQAKSWHCFWFIDSL